MSTIVVDGVKGIGQEWQVEPAATTATTLIPALGGKGGAHIAITISNLGVAATFRVWVDKAGSGTLRYRRYDTPIAVGGFHEFFIGHLEPADLVRVYASTATLDFCANGVVLS